jgi:hypothetical protein
VKSIAAEPECEGARTRLQKREHVSWQRFHGFRNEILRGLRPYGSVGPMGEATITDDSEGPLSNWPVESMAPDFLVVDDQWQSDILETKVECGARRVTQEVLAQLLDVAGRWEGCTIVVAIDENEYFVVGAHRLLVQGPRFHGCQTAADVLAACGHGRP